MSKEIFKQEENEPIGEQSEQTTKQEIEVEQEKPETEEMESEPVKQEQNEQELNEAREKLGEKYKEQKPDSNIAESETGEQKQLGFNDFFDEAKKKEDNIKLPVVGRVAEAVSNTGSSQEVRDNTAKEKVPEVIGALEDIYGNLENIKENIKTVVDLGAGWGENLESLIKELGAEKGIAIDKSAVLSKKVKEEMGDKITMASGDALEEMKRLENKVVKVDMSAAFAFLQVLPEEEKIKILKKMGEISELVVIVDELKRDGLGGLRDLFMNKLYNAGMGKYEVLKEEDWKRTFEKAGLVLVEEVFNKFGKNGFVAVLKKAEEKVRE